MPVLLLVHNWLKSNTSPTLYLSFPFQVWVGLTTADADAVVVIGADFPLAVKVIAVLSETLSLVG